MHAILLATLLLAANPTSPESARPYRLTVCLRTSDHPLMTDLFASSVRRQVEDQLKRLLGSAAAIDVFSQGHWLLDEQQHDDIEQIRFPTAQPSGGVTPTHTILVGIDYRGPDYVLSWRHVDEALQQASPIQSRRTPDRQWVSKSICLAIRDDFPVTATVVQKYPGEATLEFASGPFSKMLQEIMGEACVFRVLQVQTRGGKKQRRPVPYTYLFWERAKGTQRATIISKDAEPLKTRPGIRYEAERLSTTRGQLRLALRDSKSAVPLKQCVVAINDQGFEQLTDRELQTPNRYGMVISPPDQLLNRIAYVRIAQGSNSLKIPVAITSELTEWEVRFANSPEGLAGEDLARELRFISRDLQMVRELQQLSREQVNEVYQEKRYEDALRIVTDTNASVRDLVRTIEQQLAQQRVMVERTRELHDKRSEIERREKDLEEVKSRSKSLQEQQVALQEVIDTKNAKARAQVLTSRAAEAESDGDIDDAIALYAEALAEYPDFPNLKTKLEQLKQHWEIRDPAHRRARQFIYQTLAGIPATSPADDAATEPAGDTAPLDTQAFMQLIPEAEEHFALLEKYRDYLTAKKLYTLVSERQDELADLLDLLAERDAEESREELEKTNEAVKQLVAFSERIAEFVQRESDAAEQAVTEPSSTPTTPPPASPTAVDPTAPNSNPSPASTEPPPATIDPTTSDAPDTPDAANAPADTTENTAT